MDDEVSFPDPLNSAAPKHNNQEQAVRPNDDEDGPGAAAITPHSFATKHEEVNPQISLPTISQVGEDEPIEEVGKVMSFVDSVVIVKSTMKDTQKVLDTESLLVFDDRKVLGHVGAFDCLISCD